MKKPEKPEEPRVIDTGGYVTQFKLTRHVGIEELELKARPPGNLKVWVGRESLPALLQKELDKGKLELCFYGGWDYKHRCVIGPVALVPEEAW